MNLIWQEYRTSWLGLLALLIILLYILVGIYAPFLASSKPLFLIYDGQWYFPLFRYLFYRGFYTTALDISFNLLMFTLPIWIGLLFYRVRSSLLVLFALAQLLLLGWLLMRTPANPAVNATPLEKIQSWKEELSSMSPYARLNLLLADKMRKRQYEKLLSYGSQADFSLWKQAQKRHLSYRERLEKEGAQAEIRDLEERQLWIQENLKKISFLVMPLIRPYHWEDDAGGYDYRDTTLPWWESIRPGHKDLVAALLFGTRISLVVGLFAVSIALLIGVPIGSVAGYYGGSVDIAICRLLEIWEALPVFFMLLFVVAILQTKSIGLVILVIGLFGWTSFSRYTRGEFLKQRNLPYIEACHAIGFPSSYTMLRHILPNAIPPLLTLLPFAIMGAISTEAGLSFLGLGEAGSCSWGTLMDEGRQAFPSRSNLLWPPAILLTVLLIAIALVGDTLRDALDPHLHHETV